MTVELDERIATLETGGVRLPNDPAILTPPIAAAIRAGAYEVEEAREIPAIVRPGDRVLEIGAGIGFISTLLARQPEVERVIAVEANPALIPVIRQTHALNGVEGVEVLNAVLEPGGEGARAFYIRCDFWMSSLAAGPNPYDSVVEVPARDLNALLRDEAITLIVCDVEGAEAGLFERADLAGVERVYLETHDHITGLKGVRDLFGHLGAQGFAYDPRHSSGGVILMRRVEENERLRPYAG